MPHARRAGVALATVVAAAGLSFALSPAAQAAGQTVDTYADLQSAVSHKNEVLLGADITDGNSTLSIAKKPVSVDLQGHDLTIDASGSGGPGIDIPANGRFVINDTVGTGSVTVTGGADSAGISVPATATLNLHSLNEGTTALTATGGAGGAGIGGNAGDGAGTIKTVKGIIKATGGAGAAGIGGGTGGDGPTKLTFDNGQITATGGTGAAGIGGGLGGSGGPVSVQHSDVTGNAGDGADGIGSGKGGAIGAASVDVDENGTVIAKAGGTGTSAITLGQLNNKGIVRILDKASDLNVPSGVTVENSGLIRLYGTISGTGTIHNTGTILPSPIYDATYDNPALVAGDGQGPAGTALLVNAHNYTVNFTLDGLPGTTPQTQHVYAMTIDAANQHLPEVPAAPGYTCEDGWFTAATGGTRVLATTVLDTVTDPGPSDLLLHRHCTATTSTTTPPPPTTSPAPPTTSSSGGIGGVSTSAASSSDGGAGIGGVSTSRGNGVDAASDSLAETGWDTTPTIGLALLLLLAGAAMVYLGRARTARTANRRH